MEEVPGEVSILLDYAYRKQDALDQQLELIAELVEEEDLESTTGLIIKARRSLIELDSRLADIEAIAQGDLLWIPQGVVMMGPTPDNPASIYISKAPELGLFIALTEEWNGWSTIIINGRRWTTETKNIKHYRRKANASQINRVL